MVLLLGINVLLRYIIKKPIKGTVELEEFLLVILVFFGIAYTAIKKRHIKVDLVLKRLPESAQSVITSVTSALSIGLCVVMTWQIVVYAQIRWANGAKSIILDLPLFPFPPRKPWLLLRLDS
jgi:TRAP-type C4-dicarboxylate transport system permease small subunit